MQKNSHIPRCPKCHSNNIFGMTRVVGYYSIIENWNEGKQAELLDRRKGRYNIKKEDEDVCMDIGLDKIKVET